MIWGDVNECWQHSFSGSRVYTRSKFSLALRLGVYRGRPSPDSSALGIYRYRISRGSEVFATGPDPPDFKSAPLRLPEALSHLRVVPKWRLVMIDADRKFGHLITRFCGHTRGR